MTVEIVDELGEVTTEEVKAIKTDEGLKIELPTDEGFVPVEVPEVPEEIQDQIAEVAEEIQAHNDVDQPVTGSNLSRGNEAPVVETINVVDDEGEQQQVILVGDIEDGKQTIEVANEFGGYTQTKVKAVETEKGEKLTVPDAQGDDTVVTVPDVPEEVAEIATEDTQVVNVVTPEGETEQVVVEGEPKHGEMTVEIVDELGEVTTEEVKAVETDEGLKIELPTDEGFVPVEVPEVPEEIQDQIVEEHGPELVENDEEPLIVGGDPSTYMWWLHQEQPVETPEVEAPVVETITVVNDEGEQQQVILVGDIEDGKQTIEVANEFGGYTQTKVKAVETEKGEKLTVPDAQGDDTVVTVPDVPEEWSWRASPSTAR
ncbi:unnamed protein product [Phytophthora fragariaefolia]|uniref:Unnamed protein product n=1 Tax=Phytophthora fragariaefolia TaxID=1490495 RepID=A0A9W6YLX3_9STRA|nr:unnamed protein product [Phytophthora fragariaefolia]